MQYFVETAAILKNGRHIEFFGWLTCFIYSTIFGQHMSQVWCLHHKLKYSSIYRLNLLDYNGEDFFFLSKITPCMYFARIDSLLRLFLPEQNTCILSCSRGVSARTCPRKTINKQSLPTCCLQAIIIEGRHTHTPIWRLVHWNGLR